MNYKPIKKSEVPSSVSSRKSKLLHKLTVATYIFVVIAAIINMVGTNALATQGVVLDSVLTKTQKLLQQNRQASLEISMSTNLRYIEEKAENLGFKKIKSPLTISQPEAVAAVFSK